MADSTNGNPRYRTALIYEMPATTERGTVYFSDSSGGFIKIGTGDSSYITVYDGLNAVDMSVNFSGSTDARLRMETQSSRAEFIAPLNEAPTYTLIFEDTGEYGQDVVCDMPSVQYVDKIGADVSTLKVDTSALKTDVSALGEEDASIWSAIGDMRDEIASSVEIFKVVKWDSSNLDITVPSVNTDIANSDIPKLTFTITGETAEKYRVVGMLGYEVFDASNVRMNYIQVCQFTGQNSTEISVRGMVAGTQPKKAKKMSAWVLLKSRDIA